MGDIFQIKLRALKIRPVSMTMKKTQANYICERMQNTFGGYIEP